MAVTASRTTARTASVMPPCMSRPFRSSINALASPLASASNGVVSIHVPIGRFGGDVGIRWYTMLLMKLIRAKAVAVDWRANSGARGQFGGVAHDIRLSGG